ncbi:hypothetical protein B7494_g8533 [Chlorociboria aeruginascens]|nr:hypothetical protein B7494_g8533 [Chlorociboria aeruginascens]
MSLKPLFVLSTLLPLLLASPSQTPLSSLSSDKDQYSPSISSARSNANFIFNTVHSSMRQWGSSIQHNGMSIFPASVPEGTMFYHGTHQAERVKGYEWLAFEIEHAENFANNRRRGRRPGRGERPGEPGGPPHVNDADHPIPNDDLGGYLHTYRANRPLSLLYIDGMSAGKCTLGTLDTQDILLRNASSPLEIPGDEINPNANGPMDERARAAELCELGASWGVEGFLRTEAGFEIIFCNFTNGLDFISSAQRPSLASLEGYSDVAHFEFVRAVASRYHGIGGGRVEVDYSSMVSAFFYPMNLSNPDAEKAYLPRLDAKNTEQLSRIKSDIQDICTQEKRHAIINWQDITDMIVGRYSDRLQYLILPGLSQRTVLSEINLLLNSFIDYSDLNIDASISKCTSNYLTANPITQSDALIFTALESVSYKICSLLFDVRSDLLSSASSHPEEQSRTKDHFTARIQSLITWLDWTSWKSCGSCRYDEVCFVAMWPFGGVEDHFHPSCKNSSRIRAPQGEAYWGGHRFGGPPPPDHIT